MQQRTAEVAMADNAGQRAIDSHCLRLHPSSPPRSTVPRYAKSTTVHYLTQLLGMAELVWLHDGTDVEGRLRGCPPPSRMGRQRQC